MTVHVFGIRHHGPGSARSVRDALRALEPDIVLVEGPPEGVDVLASIAHEEMKPPVALLVYPTERPGAAVYYPFAVFSPEWQALKYALDKKVPARFMDLPLTNRLAVEAPKPETEVSEAEETTEEKDAEPIDEDEGLREDPLGMLAEAAGLSDRELWWESQVERRRDPVGMFQGIIEAMGALREQGRTPPLTEQRREAAMRQAIRAAGKEGFQKIAVVCGAWHAPVLAEMPPVKGDVELLKGLAKVKITSTWIPWTNSRLSYRSGYGAGVDSPGWYSHLWTHGDAAAVRWCVRAARLLRKEDLGASSASVIETVRLSEALAGLRDLSSPGLPELREAIRAVLCEGDDAPIALVRSQLEVGEKLGEVPPGSPVVPLQRDLESEQKRLRLKPSAEQQTLELDLRKDIDRDRSRLLHRLRLLGIPWGHIARDQQRNTGTFRETWQHQWKPELSVGLIVKNVFGHTVPAAATGYVFSLAVTAELGPLTELLDDVILAELPEAIDGLVGQLQARAAVSADVQLLMQAMPPLVRILRYGDVRQTRADAVAPVVRGLFERIVVGLPPACAQLDDDAAAAMAGSLDLAHDAIVLLNEAELVAQWTACLRGLLARDGIHGLVRGLCCKRLLDIKALTNEQLLEAVSLALSPQVDAVKAASWVEGLLRGSASTLLHRDEVWAVLDSWLRTLPVESFDACLPLLRRAFSGFAAPERAKMGTKVKALGKGSLAKAGAAEVPLDEARAALVLPLIAQLLGGARVE